VISEFRVRRTPHEVRELIAGVFGTLGGTLAVVTALGVLAAPLIILLFAPGFAQQPDKYALAVSMLRWTFPYLFFVSLTALLSGVLNSYGKFAVPATTSATSAAVEPFGISRLNLPAASVLARDSPWSHRPLPFRSMQTMAPVIVPSNTRPAITSVSTGGRLALSPPPPQDARSAVMASTPRDRTNAGGETRASDLMMLSSCSRNALLAFQSKSTRGHGENAMTMTLD
jgi:hypothetical protein